MARGATDHRSQPGDSCPSDEQLRLAQVLVRPRTMAHVLGPRNESRGTASVAAALRSGEPCFIHTDHLVLDVDRADGDRALAPYIRLLRRWGVSPMIISTGRPGHRQLVAWAPQAARAAIRERLRTDSDIQVKQTARIPGTPYRLPGFPAYRLLSPATMRDAIQVLTRPPRRPLSARMKRLLQTGDPRPYAGDRSRMIQALVTALCQAEHSEADAFDIIWRSPAGEALRAKPNRDEARRWHHHNWTKATAFVSDWPGLTLRDRLRVAASLIIPGRTGRVDTTVYRALLAIAADVKRLGPFRASVRQLADQAGVTPLTAWRSTQRLVRSGWLRRARRGGLTQATTWEILLPSRAVKLKTVVTSLLMREAATVSSLTDPALAADCFRERALGKSAFLVYERLPPARYPGIHLVARRDLRAAKKLAAVALARRNRDGTWVKLERDLRDVADDLAIRGRGKRQREQHRTDRERHAQFLAGGQKYGRFMVLPGRHRRGEDGSTSNRTVRDVRVRGFFE